VAGRGAKHREPKLGRKMKRAQIKTTPAQIAEFWSEHIDPNGFETAASDRLGCMICGMDCELRHELLHQGHELPWARCRNRFTAWNKSGLVRGHLHSAALGGSDSPENLLMICDHCNSWMPQFNCRNKALQHLRDADWVNERWHQNFEFMLWIRNPMNRAAALQEAERKRKQVDEIKQITAEAYGISSNAKK